MNIMGKIEDYASTLVYHNGVYLGIAILQSRTNYFKKRNNFIELKR